MTQKDQQKVLNKGFKTKTALESKMKALLEDPTYIED